MRAESESTYTSYSNQIHVVDTYPATGIEGHMYVSVNSGRAKVYQDGRYVSLAGEGGGSGSSIDIDDIMQIINNKLDKSALDWKSFN